MKNPTAVCCRFYVFSRPLFVFRGSHLAPSEVYRVIALLAPALTPRALKCGLLSRDLISIFIVYQPWGSILAWMLLQMNAITGEPSHPDCIERSEWITVPLEDGAQTHGGSHIGGCQCAPPPPLLLLLPSRLSYWHLLLVLCLISLK